MLLVFGLHPRDSVYNIFIRVSFAHVRAFTSSKDKRTIPPRFRVWCVHKTPVQGGLGLDRGPKGQGGLGLGAATKHQGVRVGAEAKGQGWG